MPGQYQTDVIGLPRSGVAICNGGYTVGYTPVVGSTNVYTTKPVVEPQISVTKTVQSYSGRFR